MHSLSAVPPAPFTKGTVVVSVVHAAYLWGLRVLIIYLFVQCVWILFDSYMSPLRSVDATTLYSPYWHNSRAVVVAAVSLHIGLVQALGFISERPSRAPMQRCFVPKALLHSLRRYSDSWYREGDMIVGQLIGLVLLTIGLLPFAFIHSRLLFNRVYAASLERLQRQRELLLLISGSSISLSDLHTVSRFVCDPLRPSPSPGA